MRSCITSVMHVHRLLGLAALVAASAAGAALAGASSGPAATTLGSIDELNGLACSSGVDAGTIVVSTAADGNVTFKCKFTTRGPVLRINEVMTASPISAASEFVEIVNTGGVRADLGGLAARLPLRGGHHRGNARGRPGGRLTRSRSPLRLRRHDVLGTGEPDVQQWHRVRRRVESACERPRDSWSTRSATAAARRTSSSRGRPRRSRPGASIARLPDGHDSNNNAADFSSTSPPDPRGAEPRLGRVG